MALSVNPVGIDLMREIGWRPLCRKSYAIKEASKFLKVMTIIIEEIEGRLL